MLKELDNPFNSNVKCWVFLLFFSKIKGGKSLIFKMGYLFFGDEENFFKEFISLLASFSIFNQFSKKIFIFLRLFSQFLTAVKE